MKKLINDVLTVVPDALRGYVAINRNLAVIDGETSVVRSDIADFRKSGKVAIISGGGSGHEPAHAGYVGKGMLTAAVCGAVFASPSTDAVLAALRTVGSPAGVLVIVKNYTGDRINFGLAAEIARSEGIPTEVVVVDDDVALGSAENTAGRRGIAGTVLIHKIAGAAAEAGLPLDQVKERVQAAIDAIGSMGVALSPCTVPAAGKPNFELGDTEIELGLGIHGEAGVERRQAAPSRELVDILIKRIVEDRKLQRGDKVALLVNNLGGTPAMELGIVAADALAATAGHGVEVERAYGGTFLTAIEMAGISLSLLKLSGDMLAALDAPTEAPAWPSTPVARLKPGLEAETVPAPQVSTNREAGKAGTTPPELTAAIRAACDAVIAAEPHLTEMDQIVGDGDIGRSLAEGATQILKHLDALGALPADTALLEIGTILRKAVGGTSGPLYAIFATSAGNAVAQGSDGSEAQAVAAAVKAGTEAISRLGGAGKGDRTMVDALLPAAEAMDGHTDVRAQLNAAAEAASAGAEATAKMTSRRGRSSYLGERVVGHKDPGAEAIAILFQAAAKSLG